MNGIAATLVRHRGLVATLVAREIKARYRGSVLGFFWSLVNPLLLLGVYSLVFGYVLPNRIPEIQPYGVFLVTSLFAWIWTNTAVIDGTTSLVSNSGLIRKAVFPVAVLPAVPVFSNLVHFLLSLPIIAGALLVAHWLGYAISGWTVVLLPLVIAVHLLAILGLSLGFSALHVHFKDIRDLIINVFQLLFFLTPILYPLDFVKFPWIRALIQWANPMTPFAVAYQDVLFFGRVPDVVTCGLALGWAALMWAAGAWTFKRLSPGLAESV